LLRRIVIADWMLMMPGIEVLAKVGDGALTKEGPTPNCAGRAIGPEVELGATKPEREPSDAMDRASV
jgi:hypothetical protein